MRPVTFEIGDKFVDSNGLPCEVVEYISYRKIKIRFEDGYEQYRNGRKLRKGFLKDGTRFKRPVSEKLSKIREKMPKAHSVLRTKHSSMLNRIFRTSESIKNASYQSSTICKEWVEVENFMSWAVEQTGHDQLGWHIDKDILKKGNKEYCPEFCCFVPPRINILFTNRAAKRGDCPVGVYQDKKSGRYISACRDGVTKVNLGSFSTSEKAFSAYKMFKENLIKTIAQEYKGVICQRVYEALIRYEIEITD